jgi:hypothetical protein
MDNDAKMLKEMGDALVDLQVKYRSSSLIERMALKPSLEELLNDYADYQLRLLKEGEITTEGDLQEMANIREEVDKAADIQTMAKVVARTIAFIATKV